MFDENKSEKELLRITSSDDWWILNCHREMWFVEWWNALNMKEIEKSILYTKKRHLIGISTEYKSP